MARRAGSPIFVAQTRYLNVKGSAELQRRIAALPAEMIAHLKPAVEQFEAALQLRPKWSEAHYGLSATLYELHDQDGARKELQAALELDPANTAARRL